MNLNPNTGRQRKRGTLGFSLIEVLVVIGVLAALAAIALLNIVGVANRGTKAACDTDVSTIQTAVDAYINNLGHFPAADQQNTTAMIADLTSAAPPYLHPLTGSGIAGTTCKTSLTITYTRGGTDANGYRVAGSP
jgi:prepilin-type N-terminal cleavage/methylation domain-containing protein